MKKLLFLAAASLTAVAGMAQRDLSALETANCYIMVPGTSGSFDARFKGNSTTETIGQAEGVKVVWQTSPSLVKNLTLTPEGRIEAEVDTAAGNAVVAAVDASGRTLWSWHLWVTDYDPSQDAYTTASNGAGTTWTFMTRNLGATSNQRGSFDNFGLLYQWGRKDPFPGTTCRTVMNPDYTYEVDGEPTLYDGNGNPLPASIGQMAQGNGSVELSIENPEVFYTEGAYASGDWCSLSNDDRWGGVSGHKTIYDPSPAGYKLPVNDPSGNSPYAWLKYATMKWDSEGCGAEQDGQWFPATGTRVCQTGTLDFPQGSDYSGLWLGNCGKASDNLEEFPTLYGSYMFIIDSKRIYKVTKDKRSQGMSVRCVRDEEATTALPQLGASNQAINPEEAVSVFTADGRLAARCAFCQVGQLPQGRLYIVRAGDKALKIKL